MKHIHFIANHDAIINYALAPIRHNKRQLLERGYNIKIFYKLEDDSLDCDILCLLSKPTYRHTGETQALFQENGPIIELLKKARTQANKIIWMDDSDSSTVTHFEIMPYIDLYLKKQILADRTLYNTPLYGGRIFSDFYHKHFGVEDKAPFTQFAPLVDEDHSKLRLSWNIGLGDMFSAFALRIVAQRYFPDLVPINYKISLTDPHADRPVDTFLRTSANLSRESIAFHRQEILRRLDQYLDAYPKRSGMIGNNIYKGATNPDCLPQEGGRLPLKVYRNMMANTKIVPSPFGWGELGVRDYEALIYGGLLLKPDMSHMETWPNIFIPNETYVPLDWDFGNLDELLEANIDNEARRIEIASAGQEAYRYSISAKGMEEFCDWFVQQIDGDTNA